MPHLLLRLGGRAKAAWEERDVTTVLEREFELRRGGPDLRPSVYELADETTEETSLFAVRIQAEHGASFLGNPPRRIIDVDVSGLVETSSLAHTPGQTLFAYANDCHREIVLSSPVDLRHLVEGILRDWPTREVGVTKEEVLRYVARQLDAGDDEWLAATAEGRPAHGWLRYCDRYRTRPS